jgi:uncharacterized membrane protein YfcA
LIYEFLPIILALMTTGIVAGLLAGLLGVGGGIVIVPVLYFLFQRFGVSAASSMMIATATSLATIVPTAMSSIRAHHRFGHIDWQLLRWLGLFVVIGVVGGSLLVTRHGGAWLSALFGVLATLAALNMAISSRCAPRAEQLPGRLGQGIIGLVIGSLSVMTGTGGGSLTVPILTAFNCPAHRAVGTATVVGFLIALPGALTLLVLGEAPADAPIGTYGLVNWFGVGCIVPLTVLFSPMGAKLGKRLDNAKLKKVCALVLMFTGMRMLLQNF